jgi:hypothetical protein
MAINSSPSRRVKVIVTKDKTPVITDPVRAARGILSPKNLGTCSLKIFPLDAHENTWTGTAQVLKPQEQIPYYIPPPGMTIYAQTLSEDDLCNPTLEYEPAMPGYRFRHK